MNTYLVKGVTGTDSYCQIILPSSLGILKPITEISKQTIEISKICACTFLASKQEIQSQQYFVITLTKNVYYYITLQVSHRSTNF